MSGRRSTRTAATDGDGVIEAMTAALTPILKRKLDLPKAGAMTLARECVHLVARLCGGVFFYFPRSDRGLIERDDAGTPGRSILHARMLLHGVNETVRDLAVERFAMAVGEADALARRCAAEVFAVFRGESLYLPNDKAYAIARRDMAIRSAFTGNNHVQLARRFDLSIVAIYGIVRVHRSDDRRRERRPFARVSYAAA